MTQEAGMQVRCVRPFGRHDVGDLAEVPDGARVDPAHWEPGEPPEAPAAAPGPSLFANRQEGM